VTVALGVKTGFIPPVFAAPELVVHTPHVLLGVFGILTGGGPGGGASRQTVGGELGLELNAPDQSTPYLLGTWFHYNAAPDPSGFYERIEAVTLTGGYEWRWSRLELQLGLGALFVLKDETPPCSGWVCVKMDSGVAPAFDLAARYRF